MMRKNPLAFSLIIAFLALLPYKNYASEDIIGEELRLYLGQVKLIDANSPTRIIIGNPDIADVTETTSAGITITPKAIGTTTFVFWDNFGEHSYQIKVFNEDMSLIQRRIDNLLKQLKLPEVYTKAEDEESKVFLMGRVKQPKDRELISMVLGPLKDKTLDLIEVREEQVAIDIEVNILELNTGTDKTLGFTFPASPMTLTEPTRFSKKLAGVADSFFRVTEWTHEAFTVQLDYLVKNGLARILSRPHVACQSGKEAKLVVGGETPILAATSSSVGTTTGSVEYKEYGIILSIRPIVEENGRIYLGLNIEVSDLGETEISTTYAKAFPLTKRSASTELFLNDGQTMVIGGLIRQKSSDAITKFPFFGDIPVLGILFRHKTSTTGGGSTSKSDTELFITLTPKIVDAEKKVVSKNANAPETASVEKKAEPNVVIAADNNAQEAPDSLAGYSELVQKCILERLVYPNSAKEAGAQGTVKLGLHLSSEGEVIDALVKVSSGNKILDDNAINIAKGIYPYPAFPPSVDIKDLWVEVPITYQLN